MPSFIPSEPSDAPVAGFGRPSLPARLAVSILVACILAHLINYLLQYTSIAGVQQPDTIPLLGIFYRHPFWVFGFPAGIAYAGYWQWRDAGDDVRSATRHAWMVAVLRYVLCFFIAGYGFTKLLGIQFYLGLNWQDRLVSELNGFHLTWYYFYRSRPLVLIISSMEIIGATLLLARRTTLLGAAILLPVIANATLTDFAYGLRSVAPVALLFTCGIVYLLLLYWDDIRPVLVHARMRLPAMLLPVLVLLCAFLSQAVWVTPIGKEREDTLLTGKWRVDRATVNGADVSPDAWTRDSSGSVWSIVYLEDGWIVGSSNPYVYDPARARYGHYKYDPVARRMTVTLSDSSKGAFAVDTLAGGHMALRGQLSRDTLTLALTRVKPVKWYRVYWGR